MCTEEPLYWLGPLGGCDICKKPFNNVMYDVKTNIGPWGNLCESCFQLYTSRRLGTGQGQKFERQTDGRFLCVEGQSGLAIAASDTKKIILGY